MLQINFNRQNHAKQKPPKSSHDILKISIVYRYRNDIYTLVLKSAS